MNKEYFKISTRVYSLLSELQTPNSMTLPTPTTAETNGMWKVLQMSPEVTSHSRQFHFLNIQGLLHCRQILYHLSHLGIPFPESSLPKDLLDQPEVVTCGL